MTLKFKIAIGAAAFSLVIMGAVFAYTVLSDVVSQNGKEREPEYRIISAEEAHGMMNESDSFVLLDVRTDPEYQETHIQGAVLIPDTEIAARAETELPDKDALIFVYCRSGRRSASAALELVRLGYTNVYDFGGIIDWPYDVEQ